MQLPRPRLLLASLAPWMVCLSGLLFGSLALARTESVVEYYSYHILVEQQYEATSIYSTLMSAPASERLERFKQIARARSKDPGSAPRGGELGWARADQYVKAYADTLMRLQVDEFSSPVQSQFGWHIVYLAERRVIERELPLTGEEQVAQIWRRGSTALSAQWRFLTANSESDNPYVVYIHSATSLVDDKTRTTWLLVTYSRPLPGTTATGGRPHGSARQQFAADCKRRTLGTKQVISYSKEFGDGEVVSSWSGTPDMNEVAPDTIGETILTEICNRKLK